MVDVTRGRRRRYVLIFMILTSITLATLDRQAHGKGPLGFVGRIAHSIVHPIASGASAVFSPIGDWWSGLTDGDNLSAENRKLRRQVQELQQQVRAVGDNRAEIDRLHTFFENPHERAYTTIGATVQRNGPGNFGTLVVINRGRNKGVLPDMAVLGPAGMIGRVKDSFDEYATVVLITDPSFGVTVRLATSSVPGWTETQSNGHLRIQFDDDPAKKDSIVKAAVGATVLTCGCNGSQYPPGIPVGTILRATRSVDRRTTTVDVQTLLDLTSLDKVLVVKWRPGDKIPTDVLSPTSTTVP